jgi:uncharacterized protein YegL
MTSQPQMESMAIGGTTFGFSGVGVDDLGATEYTIVTIAVDTSPSVRGFRAEIEACLKEIVEACRQSPRADNLLLRIIFFDSSLRELHGFKELAFCNPGDYSGSVQIVGVSTKLFDASFDAVGSVDTYGRKLVADDFLANGIVFVITDGLDNDSSLSGVAVGEAADKARGLAGGPDAEMGLESLNTVLIGVNITQSYIADELARYKDEGRFDQYVELDNAKKGTLAKLAAFVSQSISSQSQALGTGGGSRVIDPSSLAI